VVKRARGPSIRTLPWPMALTD